jgi:hypothetical protein
MSTTTGNATLAEWILDARSLAEVLPDHPASKLVRRAMADNRPREMPAMREALRRMRIALDDAGRPEAETAQGLSGTLATVFWK